MGFCKRIELKLSGIVDLGLFYIWYKFQVDTMSVALLLLISVGVEVTLEVAIGYRSDTIGNSEGSNEQNCLKFSGMVYDKLICIWLKFCVDIISVALSP